MGARTGSGWNSALVQSVLQNDPQPELLGGSRFTFYPVEQGDARWYELGSEPSFEKFLSAVPAL
jgi:hypothetical protein